MTGQGCRAGCIEFATCETAVSYRLKAGGLPTSIVTTVRSGQLCCDDVPVIEVPDAPLHMVATELELIRMHNRDRRPGGVDWERVRQDQFETIPFLAELRNRMLAQRAQP